MSNRQLVNAILYVTEVGRKWRVWPEGVGIGIRYVRMNRRSKSGAVKHLFEAIQTEGVIRFRMEEARMGSTTVKTNPDGQAL